MKFKWILIFIFTLFLSACQEQTTIIIFDTNGGSVIPNILLTDQQRQEELPIPEKENYLFKGWFLDAELMIPLEDSTFENVTTFQEVRLYAKWVRAFLTLTTEWYTNVYHELESQNDRIMDVVLGENHTMFLTHQGRVFTFGDNRYGQLGDGTNQDRFVPIEITQSFLLNQDETITKLFSGWGHSAAISSKNKVFTWGRNDSGQLGNDSNTHKDSPQDMTKHFELSLNETIITMSLGWGHSAALTSNSRLMTWGKNDSGQLGDGTTDNTNIPIDITNKFRVLEQDNIQKISLGSSHSGMLTSSGRIFMWGRNVYGQLGDGSANSKSLPTEITENVTLNTNEKILDLVLGWGHSSITTSSNRIFMWGFNQFGQLGNQTNEDTRIPIDISPNYSLSNHEDIESLQLGSNHSGFTTSQQILYIFGFNQFGQLGNQTFDELNRPIQISIPFSQKEDRIQTFALGVYHSAILTSQGHLYIWGSNQFGQLGDGTTQHKNNTQPHPFYIFTSRETITIPSPFLVLGQEMIHPFHQDDLVWYEDQDFKNQVTFPLILINDLTLYGIVIHP
jgi:alpha-tubulin suppressor-like RCC1 family protein